MKKKDLIKLFKKEKESLGLFLGLLVFFVFFQLKTVYGGDSGDFLSAAAVWGVPHPPGYPLYAFLAGVLHHFLAWGTPAWRLAFLSSVPSALAIAFFYQTLRLFFSKAISLISCLFLAFLYPFWLYSEAVEVFSLNNLFIISLSFFILKFLKTKSKKFLNWFFLVLGLSLAHHHTIVFLFPALFYVFKKNKLFKKIKPAHFLILLFGLLFYFYLPLAAKKNPAVNWNNPINFHNFINLITRKAYGTFTANQLILTDFKGRFFNILAFFRFVWADFSLIGIIFIILGTASVFLQKKKNKLISNYFLISLVAYIFFIFYASFNIYNDFNVATFERFLIAPYIFLIIFFSYGLNWLENIIIKKTARVKQKFFLFLFYGTFFIVFSLLTLIRNFSKIAILKNDFTAENFAEDVLNSLDKKGVIFAHSDTSHFNTQYLFYSLGYRKNEVKYVNVFMLPAGYYQRFLKRQYPKLNVNKSEKEFYNWQFFLEDNYQKIPIYSIPVKKTEGYEVVPTGLVVRYFKKEDVPSINQIIKINNGLWKNYHNPLSGSLSKYKNLFLYDVVNYYQAGAKNFGEYLIDNQKWEEAEKYLKRANSFKIKDPEVDLLLGRVYLQQKKCEQAEEQFKKVKKALPNNPFPDAYLRQVYLNCYQDKEKAKDFLDSCLNKEEKQAPKLENL